MDVGSAMVKIANNELLIIKLLGVLDAKALEDLGKELNEIEVTKTYAKRFSDVDDLKGVTVTSTDIMFYKTCRIEPREKIYTAFYACNDFQFGMARMFQALSESEKHAIGIFRDIDSVAQWLHVDGRLLKNK